MSRTAMQMALEALERLYNDTEIMVTWDQHRAMKGAITVLRAALAEPEQHPVQEPVAFCNGMPAYEGTLSKAQRTHLTQDLDAPLTLNGVALYPRRRPLTDEEMRECAQAMNAEPLAEGWPELIKFARAIENKHGIGEQHE